jgi:hypothetical protein
MIQEVEMARGQYWRQRLAQGYLELHDKFNHGKTINPETMDMPTARTGQGGDFLFDAYIAFRGCFTDEQWYGLTHLYRPDIDVGPHHAKKIGWFLRPAWMTVQKNSRYYEVVLDTYYDLMR